MNPNAGKGEVAMRVGFLLAVALLVGCATTVAVGQSPSEPPPEAVTAGPGFPAPGTTYTLRMTPEGGAARETKVTVLEEGLFEGRQVYRASDGSQVLVADKVTRNTIATLKGEQELFRFSPHEGTYSWPLWVGKRWIATYAFKDATRGRTWDRVQERWTVEAFEEVTVPAGTYRAFQLRSSPGVNSGVEKVLWYAPDIHLFVKRVSERARNHYLGPGKDVFELIQFAPPRQ